MIVNFQLDLEQGRGSAELQMQLWVRFDSGILGSGVERTTDCFFFSIEDQDEEWEAMN
jgi:hypothetical protein